MAFPLAFGFFFPLVFPLWSTHFPFSLPSGLKSGVSLRAGQGRDREDSKTRKEPNPQDSVIAHLTGEWERGFQPPFFDLSHSVPQIRPTPFPKP